MAQSAKDSRKSYQCILVESYIHSSSIMGKVDTAVEICNSSKRGDSTENSFECPSAGAAHPLEQVYEEPIENHTHATDSDRKVRNQQLKANWQNSCKKIGNFGVLSGDKPWETCDQNLRLLYLCKGIEEPRNSKINQQHLLIKKNQ